MKIELEDNEIIKAIAEKYKVQEDTVTKDETKDKVVFIIELPYERYSSSVSAIDKQELSNSEV